MQYPIMCLDQKIAHIAFMIFYATTQLIRLNEPLTTYKDLETQAIANDPSLNTVIHDRRIYHENADEKLDNLCKSYFGLSWLDMDERIEASNVIDPKLKDLPLLISDWTRIYQNYAQKEGMYTFAEDILQLRYNEGSKYEAFCDLDALYTKLYNRYCSDRVPSRPQFELIHKMIANIEKSTDTIDPLVLGKKNQLIQLRRRYVFWYVDFDKLNSPQNNFFPAMTRAYCSYKELQKCLASMVRCTSYANKYTEYDLLKFLEQYNFKGYQLVGCHHIWAHETGCTVRIKAFNSWLKAPCFQIGFVNEVADSAKLDLLTQPGNELFKIFLQNNMAVLGPAFKSGSPIVDYWAQQYGNRMEQLLSSAHLPLKKYGRSKSNNPAYRCLQLAYDSQAFNGFFSRSWC